MILCIVRPSRCCDLLHVAHTITIASPSQSICLLWVALYTGEAEKRIGVCAPDSLKSFERGCLVYR